MSGFRDHFEDDSMVGDYVRHGPPAFLPGHDGMLQMVGVLIRELATADAHVLVVGAGGGLETRALADQQPGFRFYGVDPAAPMLDLARTVIGPEHADRVELRQGTVNDVPPVAFDAATCILVLGLIPDDGSKLALLRGIRERLTPDAPIVLVDQCLDVAAPGLDRRLARYAAFALASGVEPAVVERAKEALRVNSCSVSSERDEQLIDEAGFHSREVFYKGMAWQGWIAQA